MPIKRLFATGLLVLTSFAPSAQAESLADTLRDAYHNSGLLDQNRAVLRAADEGVAQSLAALRPVIAWEAEAGYGRQIGSGATIAQSFTGSLTVSASLLIYDHGASELATDVQKALVLQTRQGLIGVEQDILLRAVSAYMNVRRATEFLSLRRSNVTVIQRELQAARDRFEVGEVTRTDVSLAEAELAAARSLLAAAEGDVVRANEEFRAAVGRVPGQLDFVSAARVEPNVEAARSYAQQNHPDVIAAQHAVSAAELNIRRAQAALNPSLSLSGSLSGDEDGDVTQGVGLSYGGTLYQGGQLQSLIREAQANRDASRSALLVTAQAVGQNLASSYATLQVAQASSRATDLQIEAAQTAFIGIREEATLGARTTLDVLNAEQDLLDARVSKVSTDADSVIASYEVLSAMGLLTAEHLNLGVQTYDPTAYYNLVNDAPATHSRQGQALDRVLQAIGD